MALSGEEIRKRLAEFAARWGGYKGTERAEAQTFLNELVACFGTDRQAVGARFEDRPAAGGGFIDMIWPQVCIVEMKRPSEAAERGGQARGAPGTGSRLLAAVGNAESAGAPVCRALRVP